MHGSVADSGMNLDSDVVEHLCRDVIVFRHVMDVSFFFKYGGSPVCAAMA